MDVENAIKRRTQHRKGWGRTPQNRRNICTNVCGVTLLILVFGT